MLMNTTYESFNFSTCTFYELQNSADKFLVEDEAS